LAKCRSIGSIRHALSTLPPTLDETYARILDRIDSDEYERPHVYRILQWVCFSFRPIKLQELSAIRKLRDSVRPPLDPEDPFFDPTDILGICSGLLLPESGYKIVRLAFAVPALFD
jgi:hypothetical protein